MIALTSLVFALGPALTLVLCVSLRKDSKWRRACLILFVFFLFMLLAWTGLLWWARINYQLVGVRLMEHGLPPPEHNVEAWHDPIFVALLGKPWLFFGYVVVLVSLAYWTWGRNREILG
jgi:hypothetical protein